MRNLNPPAIIEEYVAPEQLRLQKPEHNFKSTKEMYEWAFFHLSNPFKGDDGRTYYGIDSNGQYQSHYVSQFSDIINDNLEPQIAPIVKALHARRYLTAGSCQGHARGDKRWVRVLFYSRELMEKFRKDVAASGVPVAFDSALPQVRKQDSSDTDETYLTEMWNVLVCRRYDKFYSLRLIIANVAWEPASSSLLARLIHSLKRLWSDWVLRLFLVGYTRKLAEHIHTLDQYPM